jgi:NACHT domain- and WD repeat-containing protein
MPEGCLRMAEAARTFRVFVSSTFKDMEAERNVLQEQVFPQLKELCRSRGHRFQDIDLRWGVSEEASLDQQAMNICLSEIARCREITPRPNFIVLLGNRYGWLAPPPQIPAREFEQISRRVPSEADRDLLGTWYVRDENAVPPEYYLRPRERGSVYEKYEDWELVEQHLHHVLIQGARETPLESDPRFCASATEQEILAGAVRIRGPEGHGFAFIRELQPPYPDPANGDPVLDFLDPDQAQPEEREETPLGKLKAELEVKLPVKTYRARWDAQAGCPTTDHLDDLARDVREALQRAIVDEIEHPSPPRSRIAGPDRIEAHDALDADGKAHRDFADERCRIFVGRDESLSAIAAYLKDLEPRPLVISGEGGTGKSALLAEALRRAQRDHPGSETVYRFIGATPGSSDGRALLGGLCRELARRGYGGGEASVPTDYQQLSGDFRERLAAAGPGRPLIVFLDSLDQLSASQGARGLAWLPRPVPEGVRIVVSTRLGDTLDIMERRGAPVKELGPLSPTDGEELLRRWLAGVGRTLQPGQERAVLARFQASKGNPLYLRLASEEARRWKSGQDPEDLATGVEGIIAENTYGRLAEEDNHGEVLVSRALGYLAASRDGLSEDELLDVLSRDPDVYEWFLCAAQHVPFDLSQRAAEAGVSEQLGEWLKDLRKQRGTPPGLRSFLAEVVPRPGGPRLPVVLWSRLASDLRPYLTERAAEGASLIGFYHRELGDVACDRYLKGRELRYHGRLADYFRPELGGEDRRKWAEATLHGLGELPYQLTEAGQSRWEDLFETLTDFDFLEAKASRVGVQEHWSEEGQKVLHAGVHLLQDDLDLALRAMPGREHASQPRIIVTATDFGQGMVIRCPHCNTVHTFSNECTVCRQSHKLEDWRGQEKTCTNPKCKGPLKVNPFVAGSGG